MSLDSFGAASRPGCDSFAKARAQLLGSREAGFGPAASATAPQPLSGEAQRGIPSLPPQAADALPSPECFSGVPIGDSHSSSSDNPRRNVATPEPFAGHGSVMEQAGTKACEPPDTDTLGLRPSDSTFLDAELAEYARTLWASEDYKAWHEKVQRAVADGTILDAAFLDALTWRATDLELPPTESDSADVPWIDTPLVPDVPLAFVDCERPTYCFVCSLCSKSVVGEPGRLPKGWRKLYDEHLCGPECLFAWKDRR